MKKITLKYLLILSFICFYLGSVGLLADDKDKKAFIKGVVLDESGKNLSNGTIQIFSKNENNCGNNFLECITIQPNGSFKSKKSYSINSNVKILIAAYPYDLNVNIEPTSDEDGGLIFAYPYDLDIINVEPASDEDGGLIFAYPYDLDIINVEPASDKDGGLIFAYPYDLDNNNITNNNLDHSGLTNEPTDLNNVIQGSDRNEIEIIVKIKRSNLEEIKSFSNTISKREEELNQNSSVKLNQNYPNPFNPSTLISFNLPDAMNVTLQVYNLSGKLISTLINNKVLPAGDRHVQFNANELPSGIYIYKLVAGGRAFTQKMMLLK